MAVDKDRLYKKLNRVGEQVVRENLAKGIYGQPKRPLVEEWLNQCEAAREAATTERAEQREEETLELAREANQLAREENRLATPESPPGKWYERPFGTYGLMVIAGLTVAYLIYVFGWQ